MGYRTVGSVRIQSFTDADGPFPLKLAQVFPGVTPEGWLPYRRDYPEVFADPETWQVHFGCYLLRSQGRMILVDTGLGPSPAPFFGGLAGRLVYALSDAGVHREEIDTVLLTHLHPDHVGWNLTAEGKATFPNARYFVQRVDWETFHKPEVQAAFPFKFVDEMIAPLESLGVLDLLEGETAITDEITVFPTPGHTAGHMSVLVASGGQKAMILGDALAHPAQVTEPEITFAFDMDPELAIATRKRLLNRLELDSITGVQCHFPHPGFGLVVRLAGRRHWQPIPED